MGVIFCSFAPSLRLFVTCIISWVGATLDLTRVAFYQGYLYSCAQAGESQQQSVSKLRILLID